MREKRHFALSSENEAAEKHVFAIQNQQGNYNRVLFFVGRTARTQHYQITFRVIARHCRRTGSSRKTKPTKKNLFTTFSLSFDAGDSDVAAVSFMMKH